MRVTNKMMNNTNLTNINNNKEYLDKLNNQLASKKKITRPSDDPIVAIRALKLRSNLTEVTQYYDKNVKDAEAWLSATQDAIESTQNMVTSMRALFTQGSNATNSSQSRAAIIEELKAYKDQIYDDGNAEYAGRSLFTGYRTSTTLTMKKSGAQEINDAGGYKNIKEQFTLEDMQEVAYVKGKVSNIESLTKALASTDTVSTVEDTSYRRIRLSYDIVDSVSEFEVDGTSYSVITKEFATDKDACYEPGDKEVYLIKETGELVLGKNIAESLTSDSKISVVYDKSSWQEGDLIPENYFSCIKRLPDGKYVEYDTPASDQSITYDVSNNQKIEVNTTCNQLYTPAIGRDLEEILSALNDYEAALDKVEKLEKYLDNYANAADDDKNKVQIKQVLDAANKEVDATKEKVQKMFENYQARFDDYISFVTKAATENGTRISRVELVSNRLLDLKTTAGELADENENVELTTIATQLSEAELVYNAALMATGKVSQVTLLNYI